MIRRKMISVLCVLLGTVAATEATQAQEVAHQASSRFRVVVPDLTPLQGADRDFGRDVAEQLRTLLNTLLTHQAVSRRDLDDALDRVDVDMDELTCVQARQAAAMLDAQVALCASYRPEGDRFIVTAVFWDTGAAESFTVSTTSGGDRDQEAVARHIFGEFDRYTQHLRAAANCEEYAQSRIWGDALRNCDLALELNPDALGARYRRARTLFEMERSAEAAEELERLLQRDPVHEAALELAGYVAAGLGRNEGARDYYARFLELQPTNAAVRMRVAYDLAQAGDPRGALILVREGLDLDPRNIDLWEQYGGYAFSIGEAINRERPATEDSGSVAPDAVEYFALAIDAYGRVFAARGADTPARHLRSVVAARVRLGQLEEALVMAERALDTHGDDEGLWSIYANALQRSGRLPAAFRALARVEELNPTYPNLGLRWGNWLIGEGRIPEAVEVLKRLAPDDASQADAAAGLVVANAYAEGIQKNEFQYVVDAMVAAKDLPNIGPTTLHQLNFWHGYALLQHAVEEQEPRTVETARATLPRFREALALLGAVGDYPATVNVNIVQLRTNIGIFIEIQEAIIARGR
jgi:tetratricopeptide (TPR) repeat protein